MDVYGLLDEAHTEVYQHEKLITSVTLRREGGKIYGEIKGNAKLKIRLVGEQAADAAGAEFEMEGNDTVLQLAETYGTFISTVA